MKFVYIFAYLFGTFHCCPFFWDIIENLEKGDPVYFYSSFLICSFLNYFFSNWKENFNNNKDLMYKFVSLLFKPFTFFFNLLACEIKKFINFILKFKYRKFIDTLKISFKKKDRKSKIIWRPLFKKQSYFGYFRTNKSKWWDK